MAKKKAAKVEAVQDANATMPVRLEFKLPDHERLARIAGARGLSKAAYARQAVLERMKADEAGDKA
jgi:hypothetical protein